VKLDRAFCALLLASAGTLSGQEAAGDFKTKGHTFALKHALAYSSDAKENYMGKDRVVTTIHIVLSDKAFDLAALAGDNDPARALTRQATRGEVSYLDLSLAVDGKLKLLQWAPDVRTAGLTWVGAEPEAGTLELNAHDKKHFAGRIRTAPGTHPVDWSFDLRFDAPLVPSGK
jgi:hypothetical protein